MATFKLPRLNQGIPIIDPKGNPLPYFIRFWDEFCRQIESTVIDLQTVVADLEVVTADLAASIVQIQDVLEIAQAAQQTANDAQTAADNAAGGTARSGAATDPAIDVTAAYPTWVSGPQVDLTGVSAGNLTIPGSGPQQDSDVELDGAASVVRNFEWRVVEVVLGVDEVVFEGTFTAFRAGGGVTTTIANGSSSAASSFSLARTSTGAVSYRIDARRAPGTNDDLTSLLLYVFARRS